MLELALLLLLLRVAQKLDWLASLRLRGVKDRLVILLVHSKNQTTGKPGIFTNLPILGEKKSVRNSLARQRHFGDGYPLAG